MTTHQIRTGTARREKRVDARTTDPAEAALYLVDKYGARQALYVVEKRIDNASKPRTWEFYEKVRACIRSAMALNKEIGK